MKEASMASPVVEEIVRRMQSCQPVTAQQVASWMQSNDDDVWAHLAEMYVHSNCKLTPDAREMMARALITRLSQIANRVEEQASSDFDAFTRFEALEYLLAIFWVLWERRKDNWASLLQLKSELAQLLRTWPSEHADLVLLVVLEHIFQRLDVQQFFADWSAHGQLGECYSEAVRLAALWRSTES